jgi:signal transduction histidine kinase
MARTLHDGVLQTLALVERGVDDPALAKLARDTERDLRAYLVGANASADATDIAARLRHIGVECEKRFGVRVNVVAADDLPALAPRMSNALLGAVTEALNNVGKHAHATVATVYAEPQDGGVFCSVRDDGRGFDAAATSEGLGLRESVRARVDAVAGRTTLRTQPGDGTELCVWVPC